MNAEYEFLTEKEEIWAKMLTEVLGKKGIPHTAVPVYGAGFVMRTGTPERLRVYVPHEEMDRAKEVLEELFSEDRA